MGVRGLAALLQKRGLVTNTSNDSDNCHMYRRTIAHQSTMAIDGYGLAFHLYHCAYRRYYRDIQSLDQQSNNYAPSHLRLIPTFLPTNLIQKEIRTFLKSLVQHYQMDVQIYLDGKGRKFKSSTDTSRRKRRNKLWVNLEEFCKTGKFEPSSLASPAMKKLPSFSMKSKNNTPPPEFFLETFPIPCALLTIFELEIEWWDQQKQLNQPCFWDASSSHGICGGVTLIKCEDEADVHVARASADDVRGMTFAVGWDTDYLVFGYNGNEDGSHGHVKYVPLPSLSLFGDDEDYYHNCGRGVLEATVITRADVANILNLPNEDAVIELSILLGNDYTGDFVFSGSRPLHLTRISGTISHSFCSPVESTDDGRYILDEIKEEGYEEAVISYLNEMGANYLVEANQNSGDSNKSNEDPTMAIDFTRELFSFRDVSTFPCDKGSHDTKDSSDAKTSYSTILDQRDKIVFATRTQLLDFALLPFREGLDDDGGGDDVCYYRDITPYGRILIQPEHLQAIEGALRNDGLIRCNDCYVETTQPSKFLNWNCILAGIAFERQLRSTVTACFRGTGSVISEIVSEGLPWLDYTTMHEIFLSVSNEGLESNASSLHLEEGAAIPHQRTKRASNRQEPLESRCKLPIDNHEEQILRSVRDRQITIIHGETGCGKSSRVPIMLLRSGLSNSRPVKMFVSQPRRIAAKSLANRIRSSEPEFSRVVALRMGHGVREYETPSTRLWFVTTGYLVRLLANKPEEFADHTHLVIDEVHERSVDTDILCLLARRLLAWRPDLRLILMSATIAAEMYQQYFGSPTPPIFVGARRFPIDEFYVEDLQQMVNLPSSEQKSAKSLYLKCEKSKCHSTISKDFVEQQHWLAAHLATTVGGDGSSVLIFVAGMADIVSITEKIEQIFVPGLICKCIPIHSDIELDEQMTVFEHTPGFLKVIIATNAAESSLTIPDVNNVICSGLCKNVVYDSMTHRPMLQACWISKASATQRAGRTGRVRKGSVYRLYSRNTFESYMDDFESGEMMRMPLDSVVLSLRDMINDDVTEALMECIEPPDTANVQRSFESLYNSNFISHPSSQGDITALGSLAVALGIDLALCSLVGLGIQFGLAAESVSLAAILSFPKSLWVVTNPLYHDTDQYNEITLNTFVSKSHFDAHLYSDPFAVMNLMWDFARAKSKHSFCRRYSVSLMRIKQLAVTMHSLITRVAKHIGAPRESLEIKLPPVLMQHAKITILRILQTWVFSDSIIQLQTPADVFRQEGEFKLTVFGNNIDEALDQVLDKSRHEFTIYMHQKIGYHGQFEPILEDHRDLNAFLRSFEERFFSLSIENGCDIFWHVSGTAGLTALFSIDFFEENRSWILSDEVCGAPSVECVRFKRRESGSMRGVKCRPCGLWQSIDCPRDEKPNETASASGFLSYVKLTIHHKSKTILAKHKLRKIFLAMSSDPKLLSCRFDTPAKHNPSRINFSLESSGLNSEISQQDMQDLFYTPNVSHTARDLDSNKSQTLIFKSHQGKPLEYTTQKSCVESKDSSWNRPLLNDIPEGVRLLSVLAAGRRSSVVEVSSRTDEADPSLKLNNIGLPTMLTNFVLRWMHLEAGKVYVNAHSIPASAVPSTGSQKVFACCATTLRLKNGGIRVEDLTLLPPSSEFLKLALLSFGLSNHSFFRTIKQYEEKKCEDEKDNDTSRMRVELAIDFNHSCTKDLGKQLVCFPDKVFLLCKIFDLVDGHSVAPWDDLTHTSHLHSKASLSSGNSSAHASVENGDGTNFPEENNDGFDGVKELVDMWTSDL